MRCISSGIGSYYVVTLATGFMRYEYLSQGLSDGQAAARVGWAAPALLLLTAIPMLVGYGAFALGLFRATPAYRREWLVDFLTRLNGVNGPAYDWYRRTPAWRAMVFETLGALVGFPGFGWILAGRPFPGIPMALGGAMMAWGVMPLLILPTLPGPLVNYPVLAPALYLLGTALVSTTVLGWVLLRRGPARQEVNDVQALTDLPRSTTAD